MDSKIIGILVIFSSTAFLWLSIVEVIKLAKWLNGEIGHSRFKDALTLMLQFMLLTTFFLSLLIYGITFFKA